MSAYLALLVLNLPLIPYIARLLAGPRTYLVPFVLFFALIGSYIGQNNPTELLIMIRLGILAADFLLYRLPSAAAHHWIYPGRNDGRQSGPGY